MPTKGEIAVALRLTDEKIASDLNKAMAKMKANLSAATKAMTVGISGGSLKMGVDTVRASAAVDTHTKKVQKLTSALKEQKKAQQQANSTADKPKYGIDSLGRPLPKPKISFVQTSQGLLRRDAQGRFVPGTNRPAETNQAALTMGNLFLASNSTKQKIKTAWKKGAGFDFDSALDEMKRRGTISGGTDFKRYGMSDLKSRGIMTPGLPLQQFPKLPNAPVSKAINSQLLRNTVGAVAGSSLAGPMGAGIGAMAMGATGPIGIAIGAATAALAALKTAIMNTVQAYDQARQMYAKQLMSGGMARGFIVRQSQLADVLGVGENQVMQFGTAIGFLGHQLEFSTRTLTKTNPTLTAVSWQIKIMDQNFKALWASAASAAAPAVILLVRAISELAKGATKAANYIEDQKENMAAGAMKAAGAGTFGDLAGFGLKLWDQRMREKFKAPDVPVSINRLPASNWEKMGLVLGQGGGNDYQKKTADATSKAVVILAKILLKMAPGRGQTPAFNPQFSQF